MTLFFWSIIVATLTALMQAKNPFKDQEFYINPVNKKEYDSSIARTKGKLKQNLEEMRKVPSAYWIDVKKKTSGSTTMTVPGILADAASKSPIPLVVFIWYDLPNRDCDAKASNGEICCTANNDGTCNYDKVSDCADGLKDYKENYCDPFIKALKKYKNVPTVVVVEPDSLPNLASNADHPHCGNPATKAAYTKGYKYAVDQLASETDAAIYLDAAHGGWLGWDDNMRDFLKILDGMSLPYDRMRGFATNVANYQPLGQMCPYKPDQGYRNAFCLNGRHKSHPCCDDPCDLLGQYNPGNGEFNFAQDLSKAAKGELGWDAHIVIDTGRAGVSDMRQLCKNWCNPRNAGAGPKSTTDTCAPDMIDAYFWLKTPGESDGCTQELPNGEQCKRFDTMCGSIDTIGTQHGEPKAPEAGGWFEYQVEQLAENAHLDNFPCPSPSSMVDDDEQGQQGQQQSTWGNNNQQSQPQNNQQSSWGNNNQQSPSPPQNNQQSTWGSNNDNQQSPSPPQNDQQSTWGSNNNNQQSPSPPQNNQQSTWGSPSPPQNNQQSTWGSPSPPQNNQQSSSSSGGAGVCCWGQFTSCADAKGCQGGFCGESEANCKGNCGGTFCSKTMNMYETQPHLRSATDASTITPFVALASLAGVTLAGAVFLMAWKTATRRITAAAPFTKLINQDEVFAEK